MIDSIDLVNRIYEATVIPERWADVLTAITNLADARDAALIAARGTSFARWIVTSPEFNEAAVAHSQRYPNNLRTSRLIDAQHAGFLTDRDVLTQDEINREPVYQEFMIPCGYGSAIATAIISPSGDNIILHAEFGHTRGPTRLDIVTQLDQLRPHFARAALLSSRLGLERARNMADTLQIIGLPGGVIQPNGRLLVGNDLFHSLIPTVIQDRQSRMLLVDQAADALLGAAVMKLQRAAADDAISIPIPAAKDRVPMILHLIPVRGAAHDIFSRSVALILVTPVDRAAVPHARVLQGLFDLTPTEARVAHGIAEANTVDAVARAQGVSRETVRSHLKSVLAKTGVGRQSELVSLLAGTLKF